VRRVEYADFDLLVQRAGGGFEARVLHSPVGETGMVPFPDPFSALELENFLLKIGRPRSTVRGLGSAESSAVRDFGGRLFEGVFRGEVRDCLVSSLNQAEGRGVGLRLRLRLADCPELADLPWECLYDAGKRRHLALSGWTPLIRYLDLPGVVRPLEVTPPLRMLVLIASPTDYEPLDVEREFENLHLAVQSLETTGRLVVDRLAAGSLSALQQQLRRQEYHVFHYVGHGGYDAAAGDGVLVLEGSEGRGQQVSGQDLATLLCDYRTLRLVVLNSCEGARGGLADPYGGTAQTLIQQGIPAVVAMQFEITDKAAIEFSHTFYAALADGYPVEAATAEARKTVKNSPNPVEWATPVLYLRARDGHLFNFTETAPDPSIKPAARDQITGPTSAYSGEAARPRAEATADPRYLEGVASFYAGRWQDAVDRLAAVQADHPADPQVGRRLVEARQHRDLAAMYARGIEAAEQGDWADAVAAFERIIETDSSYQDAVERLQQARRERHRRRLLDDLRQLSATQQWAAVIAAGQELAALDPVDANPDGLVTQAHELLADEELSARYATGLRQLDTDNWIDALDTFTGIERDRPGYRDTATFLAQLQLRDVRQRQQRISELQDAQRRQTLARDWAAAVEISDQLASLDAAAADADGLASQARDALTKQLFSEARETTPALVVDASHGGDFTTVSQAIEAAKPGDRILIRPGVYEEGLVLDKPLEILGDGPVSEVIIRAQGTAALQFRTSVGRVTNLTLRQTSSDGMYYGVDITQGRLEMEGCDISSRGAACVAVHTGADPRIRRNKIHHGKTDGVYVYENGLGTVEDNDIAAMSLFGVEIATGGNPTVRGNRIHDAKCGVLVQENGLGTVEDNDIAAISLSGVEIATGGNPTVRGNRIHDAHSGVLVHENGLGTLEDNDIAPNALSGVEIKTGGNPTVRGNRIHDGNADGVYVHDNGLGTVEDNDIVANALSGVEIKTGGNSTLRHNRINRNGSYAVWIKDGGHGTIEDNDLTGNTRGGCKVAFLNVGNVTRARNTE
jgi:parallel beta-helix repeat protein